MNEYYLKAHALALANFFVAVAELEGMKAENALRERRGESPAYGEEAFSALADKHGVHWNSVCSLFERG